MINYQVKELAYYPGCTLKNGAAELEKSFLFVCDALDFHLEELPKWNCCGTVFSLQQDVLVYHLASVRNLIRAKEASKKAIVAPCSICYNTLKQVLDFLRNNPDSLNKINEFMFEEKTKFSLGDVDVLDVIGFFRDVIGYERFVKSAKHRLNGMRIAVYYGCLHSRPRNAASCEIEMPNAIEQLLGQLDAICTEYPMKNECCGSYLRVKDPTIPLERVRRIVKSASLNGAELIATLCPLCYDNIKNLQKRLEREGSGFKILPVVYLSQILAMCLGAPKEIYNPKSEPVPAFSS